MKETNNVNDMKQKTRLESQNFLTNVVTLLFIFLGVQGIDTALDPEATVVGLLTKDVEFIVSILIPGLITIIFKVVKNMQAGLFDWKKMWKSLNFITQAITVLAGALSFVGIILPPDAPADLSGAIFSGSIAVLISAIVLNVLNPIWHWLQDKLKKPPVEGNATPR